MWKGCSFQWACWSKPLRIWYWSKEDDRRIRRIMLHQYLGEGWSGIGNHRCKGPAPRGQKNSLEGGEVREGHWFRWHQALCTWASTLRVLESHWSTGVVVLEGVNWKTILYLFYVQIHIWGCSDCFKKIVDLYLNQLMIIFCRCKMYIYLGKYMLVTKYIQSFVPLRNINSKT